MLIAERGCKEAIDGPAVLSVGWMGGESRAPQEPRWEVSGGTVLKPPTTPSLAKGFRWMPVIINPGFKGGMAPGLLTPHPGSL